MQNTINKGLLIYAIQQHMFCRVCEACLDVDHALLISSFVKTGGWCLCGTCYDANISIILSAFQARNITPDIIDGRKLKRVRAPK